MMIDSNFAASVYANTSKMASGSAVTGADDGDAASGAAGSAGSAGGGVNFASFLEDKAHDALETMRASEVMSAKAIKGEADITKVVEAVTAAEVTLQTVVALRDRMISSYQEIMRMPI